MSNKNGDSMSSTTVRSALPRATLRETLSFGIGVILPTLAKGVIIRRPKMVALAQRFDLDQRAIRRVQQLRDKYGATPLLLNTTRWYPRSVALGPDVVQRVLDESPEPFAVATTEKRAALGHFEPHGVILSQGAERTERREFNEGVLDTRQPVHHLHERFSAVIKEEAEVLLAEARVSGDLSWWDFHPVWSRVVRRVVLGDVARDDQALTDEMEQLRSDANWAFFKPRRRALYERFYQHLQAYLNQAEPGSLAGVMATIPTTPRTASAQQVPQWLFAADPAGMTTFRTLALLATHPEHAERARAEIAEQRVQSRHDYPFLRACVLEALRLWPTTPLLVRQSTTATTWGTATMPPHTGVIIYTPFFHRDDRKLPFAHRFSPRIWLDGEPPREWALVPFSAGPAVCPGQNLVLLLTSTMLASLLNDKIWTLKPPVRLNSQRPLPGTLNNYALHFAVDQ
jgi:cytochrome P450